MALQCCLLSFVDRARDTKTDEIVALKKVRMDKEKDGVCVSTSTFILHDFFSSCTDDNSSHALG